MASFDHRRPPACRQSDPRRGRDRDHYLDTLKPSAELSMASLGEIREALGDARTENLLALFARELSLRPAAVRNRIGCGDLAGAASEAHSLKGAALSIGGSAVGRAAEQVEIALGPGGKSAAGTALHRAMRQLDSAVAATLTALPPGAADPNAAADPHAAAA